MEYRFLEIALHKSEDTISDDEKKGVDVLIIDLADIPKKGAKSIKLTRRYSRKLKWPSNTQLTILVALLGILAAAIYVATNGISPISR